VNPADDSDPLWSRDGKEIVFSSNRLGSPDVFRKNTGGATPEELLFETPGSTPPMSWTPDGKQIGVMITGTSDLAVFDVDGPHTLKAIVNGPSAEMEMQWSPDGRFFSYGSDDSGRSEIYLQRWPQTGERWQVSTEGGTDARWRPDGKELFYLSSTRDLMAASIDSGSATVGSPVTLFQTKVTGPLGAGHRFPYAVSRDGKRFLMYVSNVPMTPTITVIVNWQGLIKK
jgi:eukaryotic-like serine/threonine-protein kinase